MHSRHPCMSMDVGNNNPTSPNVPSFTDHDDENEPMGSNTAIRPVTTTIMQHSQPHAQPRNRPSTGSFSSVMGGVDPFWQDDSSVQLLTPNPQQPSVAGMSAASSSLFFGDHSSTRRRNHNRSTMRHEEEDGNGQDQNDDTDDDGPAGMFRSKPITVAMAEAESALDSVWNKHQVQHSPEVLAMAAQQAFTKYDWENVLRYCQELRKIDPFSQNSNKAAFCHVSTLVQLRQKRFLFRLAHEWVEAAHKEA